MLAMLAGTRSPMNLSALPLPTDTRAITCGTTSRSRSTHPASSNSHGLGILAAALQLIFRVVEPGQQAFKANLLEVC